MTSKLQVVLTSFQGGRAILELHYDDRHARLELDQLEDRYTGQPTPERAREELERVAAALAAWLKEPQNRIAAG